MGSTAITDEFSTILDGRHAPYGFYARARASAPIFWSEATGGWVVAKRDAVARVLEDETAFGPLGYGAGSSMIHGRVILHMSGREHRRKSALIGHRIRSPRILENEIRPLVERLADEYLDALPADSPVDLKQAFTTPLPLQVTADIMGIPEAPRFRSWYETIVAAGASNLRGDPEVLRRGQAARASLAEFLKPVIAARRAEPQDDLLSDLCTFEYEGSPLDDDEITSFCSFLLAAGVETTDRALSSLVRHLVEDPGLWTRLATDRDLITSACAEILRYAPPVHGVSRGVLADTELAGQRVETGQRVFVLIASANRDEEVFDRPEEFLVDRFEDDAHKQFTPRSDILPFGAGRHHCTGSLLAQLEMVVAMNHLFDRFPEAPAWAGAAPDEVGYVLRSPGHLRVVLEAA